MYKPKEESNGKQPEEIAMMPKRGWGSDGKLHEVEDGDGPHCGMGPCKPPILQRFSSIWTFTILVGFASIGSEFLELLLKCHMGALRRQFQVEQSTVLWMTYSSEIACLISAFFLSIFARRIHIPRALAISSLVCGVAGILCIVPFLATKDNLAAAPVVSPNHTYSMERYRMMAPSCIENKKAMAVVQKLMMEAAASRAAQPPKSSSNDVQPSKPKNLPNSPLIEKNPSDDSSANDNSVNTNSVAELPPRLPPAKATAMPDPSEGGLQGNTPTDSVSTDSPQMPSGKTKTITIPDFKKLSTHQNFPKFVQMAKGMGIDLEKVAAMDLDEQIRYVDNLPPNVKKMLPSMKLMLGPNADSYFLTLTVPDADAGSERGKRSVRKGHVNLETDLAYTGQLVKMMKRMPPLPPGIMEKAFKELCPFNTGPFLVNASTGVLKVINVAMVLQGIAKGPRIAYGLTFLSDNTKEGTTALHLGIMHGIFVLGPAIMMVISLYTSTIYITAEDVGAMTIFNPRWLGAWWLTFLIIAVFTITVALPLLFFPRKLKSSNRYTVNSVKGERSCFTIGGYFTELMSSLLRLCSSPVYLSLILGLVLSAFASVGSTSVLMTYATHQFSLGPIVPGLYLVLVVCFLVAVGIFIGGIISTKCKLSSLGNLKLALGLALALVIIQACHLGFGCSQPPVDKGSRVVANISSEACSSTCPCDDLGFSPGCGSDGRTYYSPCHAGCGEGYDGKFHDCKCIEDSERTVTPGYCPTCNFFYPFCIAVCLGAVFLGIQYVPFFIAIYRSVKPKDIPMAIGFLATVLVATVAIPSPALYKNIQDAQCLRRIPECGELDTCVLFDIENLRYQIYGLSLGLTAGAAILILVAFVFGRKSSIYHEQIYDKDQVKS